MKTLSVLLFLVVLLGATGCGSDKDENKTPVGPTCTVNCATVDTINYTTYTGSDVTIQEVLSKFNGANGGFKDEGAYGIRYTFLEGKYEAYGSFLKFETTADYFVDSYPGGTLTGHFSGTSKSDLLNNLYNTVSAAIAVRKISDTVYKILKSDNNIIYLDFSRAAASNPVQTDFTDGTQLFSLRTYQVIF